VGRGDAEHPYFTEGASPQDYDAEFGWGLSSLLEGFASRLPRRHTRRANSQMDFPENVEARVLGETKNPGRCACRRKCWKTTMARLPQVSMQGATPAVMEVALHRAATRMETWA